MTEHEVDTFAPHVRRNFFYMGGDIALFIGGINFSAWSTILPIFIRHLTSSNLVLGLLPAVRNVGLNVPPILVSHHVGRLRHYKRYILVCTVFERLPFLLLGLATLVLGTGHPEALLIIFFVAQLTISIAGGITNPAWLNLVSLMIPVRLRGRFFGVSGALGGLLGVGAAALTVEILKGYPFPQNFAICFLATFFFLVLSFVMLALSHEPEAPVPAPSAHVRGTRDYLATLPAFLRRERNFATFLVASVFGNILMAISPFVSVAASRALHVSDSEVGAFGVVLLAVSTLGSLCWGWLGDHAGYRPVLIGGNAAGIATVGLALFGLFRNDSSIFYGVFASLGVYSSATQLASFTFVTEFGTREDRPTFTSLSSLVLAPVAVFAPILGGVVADAFGYNAIFEVCGVCLTVATVLYVFAVKDPGTRHSRQLDQLEPSH